MLTIPLLDEPKQVKENDLLDLEEKKEDENSEIKEIENK